MKRALLSLTFPTLLLAACGGKVVIDSPFDETGGSATGGAGGAVSMSASAGVGAGGAGTGAMGAGAGVGTSATVGAGGSTVGCSGGYVELTIDGDDVMLGSSCTGDIPPVTVPFGRVVEGGVGVPYQDLSVEACATSAFYSQGVIVVIDDETGTGEYGMGSVVYDDAQGVMWSSVAGGFKATVSQFGPVGALIVGTFAETITNANVTHLLQGKFSVCRLPDAVAP
jgi:hypothetical protein